MNRLIVHFWAPKPMKKYWRMAALAAMVLIGSGPCNVWAEDDAGRGGKGGGEEDRRLHIQHAVTTSQANFPQFVFKYHVLDGADSNGEVRALKGTLSLENHRAEFSEVLWVLAYMKGQCPAHDESLTGAQVIWTEIQKNPTKSASTLSVDLHFPHPLPMSGCLAFVFAGGPLVRGAGAVTMSAALDLEYKRTDSPPNTIVDLAGEYCFGQNWGCQNATTNDKEGFAVPITMPEGYLVELYGNISDSSFDGKQDFGPLPTGEVWGAVNDLYLLPGGCGKFALNGAGFPHPVHLATLNSWFPDNAIHLDSVPMDYQIPHDGTSQASLTRQIETILPYPVKVESGDCLVVIYGRKGNGATDNETQIHAVLTPAAIAPLD